MKQFELNKIYKEKDGCGCGYDESTWCNYFMPVKKSKSSIWVAELRINLELYGKTINTEEEADKKAKKAFANKWPEVSRKTFRSDEEQEYFMYKDNYTFAKYVEEVL